MTRVWGASWFFSRGNAQPIVLVPAKAQSELVAPVDKEAELQKLLIIVNESKVPDDLNKFLTLTKELDRSIILELQIPGIDLVTVVAGKVRYFELLNGGLIIYFYNSKELNEPAMDQARSFVNKKTDGNPRRHNPPYCVSMNRDYRISKNNTSFYEIVGVHLIPDLNDK